MAKDINVHTEKMDQELLLEQNRQVNDIVRSIVKRKSTRKKELNEEEPLSDNMKEIIKKR